MKTHLTTFALAVFFFLVLPKASHRAASVGIGNPTGVTGEYNGSVTTGGSYDPYTGNAKRIIDDLTVTGSIGAYPLKWTRILNTRGISTKFGMGGGWSHGYYWGLSIAPTPPNPVPPCWPDGPDATVYYPDGATRGFRLDGPGYIHADLGEPGDQLVHVAGDDYDFWMKDGGRVEFRTVNGHRHVAKYIVDPYGQRTTLEYASNHLWKVIEPGLRYLEISYSQFPGIPGFPAGEEKIDSVKAYDGPQGNLIETVSYQYTAEFFTTPWLGTYRLINLTQANYDDNTHAAYTYLPPAALTPGDWSHLMPGRVETCDDPRFSGAMQRIKYEYTPPWEMVAGDKIHGHIKAERNMTTNDIVSHMDYPNGGWFTRVETRGDGATRRFEYGDAELISYTDFAYPGQPYHTTTISFSSAQNPDHYWRVVKDARLHSTTTEKERSTGAVMAVIHPGGSSIKYTYDPPANVSYPVTFPFFVASKEDERTKVTYYDRDGANRVWRIRYPDDGTEFFTYDNNPFGLVHEHTMTSGGIEVFEYDSRGLKTSYTPPATLSDPHPEEHKTLYFYYGGPSGPGEGTEATGPMRPDLRDRLQRVIDPLGNSTWYEYNGRGQVTKLIHTGGTSTRNFYYPDGTLQWTEDELSHRTSYEYDEYRRVTKTTNALFRDTIYSYAPWNGHGALSHTTSSIYLTTLPSQKKIKRDYDANFRLIETTEGWNTAEAASTTSTYDEVGNLSRVKDPKGQLSGRETIYGYDERNRRTSVTDPLGPDHTTSWLYDDANNMIRETRADLKFRTWDEYDAMNRVRHTTGFLNEPTSYEYDHAGNRTKITDANQKLYKTTYDELNRKKYLDYPTDVSGTGRYEYWRYDIAGNLTWYMNTAFQFKHFEYDVRNRLRRSYWNNLYTSTTPDRSIGPETAITPDGAGRVTEIRTNGGETIVAFGYDNANRKIWEDQTLAGLPTRHVETMPDVDGNRGTLSVAGVPGDYSFTFDYTQRQQLWHINRGGSPYVEFAYDPNDNLTRRQNMAQGQGRDATRLQYDDLNRVTICEQTGYNDESFARSNYNDYDLVNNLKSISRHEDGDKGETFIYDDANQLSSVSYRVDVVPHAPGGTPGGTVATVNEDDEKEALAALVADPDREPFAALAVEPEVNATGPRTVSYNNDAINRLSMTDNGAVTSFTPNHLNQYTAVTGHGALTYNTNFSLWTYDSWVYVYDAEKQLISASTASDGGHNAQFAYDGLGRCVRRTVDGATTVFTYDAWKPVAEWTGTGAFVAWNLYGAGADEILVRYQQSPVGYLHYHLDAMGNVQFLLSDQPNPGLEKYTYDVFGKPTITGWNGDARPFSNHGNRFLFTGREYLYTLGIYDYRHRLYHPGLGRFIQTDPIGFEGDPLNLYRYCIGNPVLHIDPMGTYAQGSGWNKENWDKFKDAQEHGAKVTGGAADRIENALKNGGKELDSLKKNFEGIYGPGSATEKNLREVDTTLRGMEGALRDNGQLGYYANAATKADAIANGGSKDSAAWTFPSDRHSLYVNTDHANFGKPSLVGTVIHETSHNLGLIDAVNDRGTRAYRHGDLNQQAYFKNLPFKEPEKALRNADTLTSFVVP